jgi:hypothetical protein
LWAYSVVSVPKRGKVGTIRHTKDNHLSLTRAGQLYRIESLNTPLHFPTAVVLRDMTKWTPCILLQMISRKQYRSLLNSLRYVVCCVDRMSAIS